MDAVRRGMNGAEASRSTANEWGKAVGNQATGGLSRNLGLQPNRPATGAAATMDVGSAGTSRALSRSSAHVGAHATAIDARANAGMGTGRLGGVGLNADAHAAGYVGAQGTADAKLGITGGSASAGAFAGAKAGAGVNGSIVWDKDEDYGPMLRDHFNNFPGQWDDRLLDNISDAALSRVARILFGDGSSRLATAAASVDARAGLGASASGSLGMERDGMVSVGAGASATAGVGMGANTKVGLNPRELIRYAMARGMADTNKVYAAIESVLGRR